MFSGNKHLEALQWGTSNIQQKQLYSVFFLSTVCRLLSWCHKVIYRFDHSILYKDIPLTGMFSEESQATIPFGKVTGPTVDRRAFVSTI